MDVLRYNLIRGLCVAGYAGSHFVYDRRATESSILCAPTQRISPRQFEVFERLRRAVGASGQTLDELRRLFADPRQAETFENLVRAGYLEPVTTPPTDDSPSWREDEVRLFVEKSLRHCFRQPSFCNLPAANLIPNEKVDVGFVGLPVSSLPLSNGTVFGPRSLRDTSQSQTFWFDVFENGLYSEIGLRGGRPALLGKGVTVKDFGDIGQNCPTVGDLMMTVRSFIENTLLPNRTRSVFVGGDHAISLPIIDTYVRHFPDLALLHLDAHNDLFYLSQVDYNHAGPIRALLLHSGLASVHSFGLRTHLDSRVAGFRKIMDDPSLSSRIHLFGLSETKLLAQRTEGLRSVLAPLRGRPCYLSIDLDVLSPSAIDHQLSSPAGSGLEWDELFGILNTCFEESNIIACDIVELNPLRRSARLRDDSGAMSLLALVVLLIDRMAKGTATPRSPEVETGEVLDGGA